MSRIMIYEADCKLLGRLCDILNDYKIVPCLNKEGTMQHLGNGLDYDLAIIDISKGEEVLALSKKISRKASDYYLYT